MSREFSLPGWNIRSVSPEAQRRHPNFGVGRLEQRLGDLPASAVEPSPLDPSAHRNVVPQHIEFPPVSFAFLVLVRECMGDRLRAAYAGFE
jgi:hypothetical protein